MTNLAMQMETKPAMYTRPHSHVEDALAMLIATFLISFGMMLMQQAGSLTGGTAGLALLLHYVLDVRFGLLFFLINIPFYYLAYKQLGLAMVVKTFIAVALLSLLTELHPHFIHLQGLSALYGTILANLLMGIGFLILFRHRSSLGGMNLLALFIQKRYGIAAGKVQMSLDVCILLASMPFINFKLLGISILGALVLNMILTINHRPDRYVA
jgi:uncharacterized membrane-anchored protein YitT (DUF2179 family)